MELDTCVSCAWVCFLVCVGGFVVCVGVCALFSPGLATPPRCSGGMLLIEDGQARKGSNLNLSLLVSHTTGLNARAFDNLRLRVSSLHFCSLDDFCFEGSSTGRLFPLNEGLVDSKLTFSENFTSLQ